MTTARDRHKKLDRTIANIHAAQHCVATNAPESTNLNVIFFFKFSVVKLLDPKHGVPIPRPNLITPSYTTPDLTRTCTARQRQLSPVAYR